MATILGANTLSGGYEVANSCRFNRADGPNMTKTPGSSGDLRKWTWSCWVKRGSISNGSQTMFNAGSSSNTQLRFDSDDSINFYQYHSGAYTARLATNRKFKDVTAWYHIVAHWDTDNGTGGDRMKLFVNGVEETSFGTDTNPNQNLDSYFGASGTALYVGDKGDGAEEMDGYLAEMVFIDGQNLAPTSFGEFDSDTPTVWKPIDVTGLTFGTNGYYLDFEDSSALGSDAAGSNNFTVNNLTAIDQSTDTCSNNGCTWNPLIRSTATFTNGNLTYQAPSSNPVFGSLTTFGVNSGKWYAECKYHAGSNHYGIIGIADEVFAVLGGLGSDANVDLGKNTAGPTNCTVAYVINTGKIRNNNNNQDYGSGGGDGDIINIALDRDNRKVYFGINGTYENSGNPGSGSNGFDLSSQVTGDTYFLGVTNDTGASETVLDFNFGGGFGQTAVSSGNSDANGYGNFEYAVPSGFYAWNSKNLAEFG